MLSMVLVTFGALIMLHSLIKYYEFLIDLKTQVNSIKLFNNFIDAACFLMMIFFLASYAVVAIVYALKKTITPHDTLVALIFFLGSVFSISMVNMVRRMFTAISKKAELEKQLKQQELMSQISQSFTTTDDPDLLINNALRMTGNFLKVNHSFLLAYIQEEDIIKCNYEWQNEETCSLKGKKDKWSIILDMEICQDIINNGHAAIEEFNLPDHPNYYIAEDYHLGTILNIPINISGKLWGILGFIHHETPHSWDKSVINLGRQIAGIFSGVINRNIINEQLIRAKNLAEQGSQSKSEFLSRMSHEMRTPMNAIIGMTNIGKTTDEIERKDYCLNKIGSASTHLLGVINDILDMSKIEANKLEISSAEFCLEEMLAKVINVVSYQMEQKRHRFVLSVDQNVPKFIKSDEQRLSQVITNLMGNAVKFTPDEGTISLIIRRLEADKNSGSEVSNDVCRLQFEVKDTGIGIPKEQQSTLFKPFSQADGSISRKYGGTGLGLAISKRIIELLNGKIYIESAAGKGTSFIFDIYTEAADYSSDAPAEAGNTQNIYTDNCFEHLKILIAEDIEINREIVGALLESTGITIDFAENGEMAYRLFSKDPSSYNMIFMDIHMPELNGFEATRLIREFEQKNEKNGNPYRRIPVIAMTADVFHEDIKKCMDAGMDGHVGKPLNMDDVYSKIVKHCNIDRDQDMLAIKPLTAEDLEAMVS